MTARMHAVDQWKHQTVPWKHAMCTEAAVEVTSRSMEHSGKQQIIATVLYGSTGYSGSYPAAADHSNSAIEAQASNSYPAAADHSNSTIWKHRLVTAIQQQQIIATVYYGSTG